MFRNTRVSTLHELKRVILSHLGADGPRDIRRLAYRFQSVTPDDRLEYRPSWLSEDRHVWITFEVHRRIMQDRFMEFLAEVRHVGGSSGFRPYQLPTVPSPINIVPPDYNSYEDSDYDDESSSHSTDEDEQVPNTPAAGGPRLWCLDLRPNTDDDRYSSEPHTPTRAARRHQSALEVGPNAQTLCCQTCPGRASARSSTVCSICHIASKHPL
ncbi:hypothetical protein PIB30_013594 [Stylosanthes scabra]|uniref:Uncharacterized protein n=1 Tax=Stylosanthes scabra TaxID=79078 RepID=A0ABU6T661_9FABA|nr:hypothetical protein [Stylosanthes scabra]